MVRQVSLVGTLFLMGAFPAFGTESAEQPSVNVSESTSRETLLGAEKFFTGQVWIDPLFVKPQAPQRASGAYVTFEPGARTAWHTHPVGQTLVVISGAGWVQEWGKEKITIKSGDVINFAPGVKHWHGATDKTSMVHLAIQELNAEGKNVDWLEKVSNQQYTE